MAFEAQVVVAGYGSEPVPPKLAEDARALVSGLAETCRPTVLVGGYWGVMRVVVDEAIGHKLKTVMVLPVTKCDVRVPGAISICTGMDFRERSSVLVRSGDVLISLGGGIGTILEIALAYAYSIPVVVVKGAGMASDRLEDDWSPHIDERALAVVRYVEDARTAAEQACKLAASRVRQRRDGR